MGRAKEIIVKVIPAKIANEFVKKHHYSGKVVASSAIHFGAFLDGMLHGVMSYGSPMQKSNVIGLVQPCLWNEMLELNRMAFDDYLPKNSESRCISISIKLLKKNASHIKWLLSYSDATQCGDGTIYRASGFKLTQINKNKTICQLNSGEIIAKRGDSKKYYDMIGSKPLNGFQNRYIYLIDKSCKITVPILPFSKIDEMGAGMYKGKKITQAERHKCDVSVTGSTSDNQSEGGVRTDHIAQIRNNLKANEQQTNGKETIKR